MNYFGYWNFKIGYGSGADTQSYNNRQHDRYPFYCDGLHIRNASRDTEALTFYAYNLASHGNNAWSSLFQ